jgi:hypothetical protein
LIFQIKRESASQVFLNVIPLNSYSSCPEDAETLNLQAEILYPVGEYFASQEMLETSILERE